MREGEGERSERMPPPLAKRISAASVGAVAISGIFGLFSGMLSEKQPLV
jgi:hypothetical protein